MKIYFAVIGLIGVGVNVWAVAHYHMPPPLGIEMGLVPGSLIGAAWTGFKR